MRQILDILTNNMDCPDGAVLWLPARQFAVLEAELDGYRLYMRESMDRAERMFQPLRAVHIQGPRGTLIVRSLSEDT